MSNANAILSMAQKNNAEEIKKLIELGISANHSNPVGQTPLHISLLWGNFEATEVLVEAGANLDATNKISGGTPLHMAGASDKNPEGVIQGPSAVSFIFICW